MTAMQIFTVMFGMAASGAWGYFCGYNQGKVAAIFEKDRATLAAQQAQASAKGEQLTDVERAFVELVKANPGRKLGHDQAFDVANDHHPLWRKPEELGLIECVGSYKWIPVVAKESSTMGQDSATSSEGDANG